MQRIDGIFCGTYVLGINGVFLSWSLATYLRQKYLISVLQTGTKTDMGSDVKDGAQIMGQSC